MIRAAAESILSNRIYSFDSVPVMVSSDSSDVSSAVGRIMGTRTLANVDSTSVIEVSANLLDTGWQICVDDVSVCVLPASSVAPSVAADLISTACAVAARRQGSILLHGAVLEKSGVGLALIGSDMDAVKTLAFHLHARRWTAVSFGYSFLNSNTLTVTGLQALAAVSSAAIDKIPRRYRRAIEASKWYDSGAYLTFYAVDPIMASSDFTSSTTLHSVVVVDQCGDEASPVYDSVVASDGGLLCSHPMVGSICFGRAALGHPIALCDALERWVLHLS